MSRLHAAAARTKDSVFMQSPLNAVGVFLILSASAGLGFFIHTRLPEHHRSPGSLALVQLVVMLLVNFTAIVLGLLTTSVKTGFDAAYQARGADAAQIAQLDPSRAYYGPQAAPIRAQLRDYVAGVIVSTWPDEPLPVGVKYPDPASLPRFGESSVLSDILNDVGMQIRSLQPSNPVQKAVLADCDLQFRDMLKARWKVIEGEHGSITPP
jgi:hypothetical protein